MSGRIRWDVVALLLDLPPSSGGRLLESIYKKPGITTGELLSLGLSGHVIRTAREKGAIKVVIERHGVGGPRKRNYLNWELILSTVGEFYTSVRQAWEESQSA